MSKVVLVVDDEPILREILVVFFRSRGFEALDAENGREAFHLIETQDVDCVVSDIRMAGGSGIELAQRIHEKTGKKPKILLMTGYSDLTWEEAQKWGVLRILNKPFDPEIVVEEVCKALAVGDSGKA